MKYGACVMLFAVMLVCCPNINFSQNTNSPAASVTQDSSLKTDDNEKIYKQSEVDTKAVLKKKPAPSSTRDCPDSGTVRLRAVLDKSGKVTNVKLIKGTSCGFDDNAIKAAQKIKFTPALKNGIPVSVYVVIEYHYTRF